MGTLVNLLRGTSALLAVALVGCDKTDKTPVGPACGVFSYDQHVNSGEEISRLDLLFVVDTSPTIAPHLARLRAALPAFFDKLTIPVDPNALYSGTFSDVQLGVISSDLGVGAPAADGCSETGDDARLRGATACGTPGYVWYYDGYSDRADTLSKLDCAFAQLTPAKGSGCAVTQPLEAALKAVSSSTATSGSPALQFAGGSLGQGDRDNAGFVRRDWAALTIVIVTDRDDCSSVDPEVLADGADNASARFARCLAEPDLLAPLQRYLDGYSDPEKAPERASVVLLAGIPHDLFTKDELSPFATGQEFYDHLLAAPQLQLQAAEPISPGTPALVPSCMAGTAPAYPPRRLLTYLRASEDTSLWPRIASLCDDDLAGALFGALHPEWPERFGPCVTSGPARDASSGLVSCSMTWDLPLMASELRPLTPTRCDERPAFLSVPPASSPQFTAIGRAICDVPQLPVFDEGSPPLASAGSGFYFDNSDPMRMSCFLPDYFKISYAPDARPPDGVNVSLHCEDDAQHEVNPPQVFGAAIGERCDLPGSAACSAIVNDGTRLAMFCHPTKQVCVRGCAGDSDCPQDWKCDAGSSELAASAGRAICVNPSCSDD